MPTRLLKLMAGVFVVYHGVTYATVNNNIILFIWDGLRPDSITEQATPNLFKLAQKGTYFNDHHSSFPTLTMVNAASFATGDFAGKNGYYGNVLWNTQAQGNDAQKKPVDFQQPVFTEDYKILTDLNQHEPLTQVYTLFNQVHKAGIMTATVGKAGPAYFQDYKEQGIIFDEDHVFPRNFAEYLQSINYSLPINTQYRYSNFNLHSNNGNPTKSDQVITMVDEITSDPSVSVHSPHNKRNTYLMDSYLNQIMPRYKPGLSVIWLRNPDTTEHTYGVGTKSYYDALANQDMLLGKLITNLKTYKQWDNTNIIVVSDHGHSNVSGPLSQFPLRAINNGRLADIDNINGYSTSGNFRPADLLNRAGFKAYDGSGCEYDPILSGITKDGYPVYPTLYDKDGDVCGKPIKLVNSNSKNSNVVKYSTPSYLVPKKLPNDSIIVAANGGATFFYIPNHNQKLVEKLVRFSQSRQEFGAVFVDERYGDIPGTLKLATIKLQNNQQHNPDIIVSSNYDERERIQGFSGIEFNSGGSYRGVHGTFSPTDIHNTLVAYGPDFKKNYIDQLPSGNVDIAPTIAYLLGLHLDNTDGRVLYESLSNKRDSQNYDVQIFNYTSKSPATKLIVQLATSPDGKDIDTSVSNYNVQLQTKSLNQDGKKYSYFDWARAIRY